jgi:hypothetical protein
MAPRPAYRLVKPEDRKKVGRPRYQPEPMHRQLVEILISQGASEEAICRELSRMGLPVKHRPALRKAFKEELAHGKERRVLAYGIKMHSIAMSDNAGNVAALRFMLGVIGGRMWQNVPWRDPDEMPEVPQTNQEVVHFYMPPNGRDQPVEDEDDGPIIEGDPL